MWNNSAAQIDIMLAHEGPSPWWDCMNGTQFYQQVTWPTVQVGGATRARRLLLLRMLRTRGERTRRIVCARYAPCAPATHATRMCAVLQLQWGGWYDIFINAQLAEVSGVSYTHTRTHTHTHAHTHTHTPARTCTHAPTSQFNGFQYASAPSARGQQRLFIDVLGHCFFDDYFPPNTILGRAVAPILLVLDLLADGNASVTSEGLKAVTFYVMGSSTNATATGNYWTTMDAFPAYVPTRMYLQPVGNGTSRVGSLSLTPPGNASSVAFTYNPAAPVPTIGGNNLFNTCGPMDQRSVEALNRTDVLTFTSDPLAAPLAITGPLVANLFVSSNCTDTDFTVKLTDVHPDGTSALIQDGIIRMRWRDAPAGSAVEQPMVPGAVYPVAVDLWDTSFVFDTGHSVRVDISSSNAPRFAPNPNTGLPVNANSPNFVARNIVHTGGATASSIILPVVDMATQLPPVDLFAVTQVPPPPPASTSAGWAAQRSWWSST